MRSTSTSGIRLARHQSPDRLAADHRSGGDRRLHAAGFEPEHRARRRQRHAADRPGRLSGRFADGLQLYAGNSTVRGLVINQFRSVSTCRRQAGNVIEGNFIGTDATGLVDLGNTDAGIAVRDSPDNTIGGTSRSAQCHFGHEGELPEYRARHRHYGRLLRSATWCRGTSSAPMPPAARRWATAAMAFWSARGGSGQRVPDHDQRQSHLR